VTAEASDSNPIDGFSGGLVGCTATNHVAAVPHEDAPVPVPIRAWWWTRWSSQGPSLPSIGLAWLGACLGIALLGLSSSATGWPMVLGSFGASCVLLFGYPEAPFSRARSVIGGHVLCSIVGMIFLRLLGPSWWAMGLAAGTALAVMMGTRTVHPPAGSNAVIVFLTQPEWSFVLFPTAIGAVVLTVGAGGYQYLVRKAAHQASAQEV